MSSLVQVADQCTLQLQRLDTWDKLEADSSRAFQDMLQETAAAQQAARKP